MAGEGGLEAVGGAGVGAHGLHPEAKDGGLRQVAGGVGCHAWRVRPARVGVGEGRRVIAPGGPAGAVDQPAARREGAVLGFPAGDVGDVEQVVGVGGRLGEPGR